MPSLVKLYVADIPHTAAMILEIGPSPKIGVHLQRRCSVASFVLVTIWLSSQVASSTLVTIPVRLFFTALPPGLASTAFPQLSLVSYHTCVDCIG